MDVGLRFVFAERATVIFHYYLRKDTSRHWNDATSRDLMDLQARTLRRLRMLCEPDAFTPDEVAELGRYGLGTRRSLAEYEAFTGVSFAARSIAVEARSFPFVRLQTVRDALALTDALRPAPGTQLFVLGDEGVLFHEPKGTLHRLNEAATRNWCALEAGWEWERIAADAASARGIPVVVAISELRELATHWIGEGLLRDISKVSAVGPRLLPERFAFRDRDYRLLDAIVRLRFGDASLEALIHPAFAHLTVPGVGPAASTITVVRILDWHYIFDGDQMLLLADTPRKLVPKLKAELMARAIARHDHVLHLHAAAVAHVGRLMLLPASSGNGKTVLTARLLSLGCEYFSDEAVLRRRDGTVRPIPTALSIKTGGAEALAARFPGSSELPEHDREDGVAVRYLRPPQSSMPVLGRAARPELLVFPRFVPNAPTTLRRLSRADALARVLAECLAIPHRLDTEAVATIVEAVEHASAWEVTTGELDVAAGQLMCLLQGRQ